MAWASEACESLNFRDNWWNGSRLPPIEYMINIIMRAILHERVRNT